MNVRVLPLTAIEPVTVAADFFRITLPVVTVDASIASLKTMLIEQFVATPVLLENGFVEITVGAVVSTALDPDAVVKVHV